MGGFVSGQTPWRRVRRVESGADPAAGAEWSVTVEAGKVWELLSVFASLVTDATVATRAVRLQLGDGGVTYLDLVAADTQVASLTRRYAWLPTGAAYASASGIVSPLPRLILEPGWTLASVTDNLAAGDNWSAPRLLVVETTVRGGPVSLGELPELYVEVVSAPAAG
jgi:hypothetical protein